MKAEICKFIDKARKGMPCTIACDFYSTCTRRDTPYWEEMIKNELGENYEPIIERLERLQKYRIHKKGE